jgi:opacity protein-like surface antigen
MGLVLAVSGAAFAQTSDDSTTTAAGVMADVGVTVFPHLQVVGDVGYAHKYGTSLTTFAGGLRYLIPVDRTGRITPFVEGLVGGAHLSAGEDGSTNAATFGGGGGVDIQAYQQTSIRLQVNYFHTQKYGVAIHEVRFGMGVSFGNKLLRVAGGWAPTWAKVKGASMVE